MKARQLQMQFHKLLHLTSTHYTFEKISIFLPRSCRVIFQEKTKSSRELFSVLQSDVFSVTVVIRKNVFISELRKLIELLKHKSFLRKGCLRISFKWLETPFWWDRNKIFCITCGWVRYEVIITSFGFVLSKRTSGNFLNIGIRTWTFSMNN